MADNPRRPRSGDSSAQRIGGFSFDASHLEASTFEAGPQMGTSVRLSENFSRMDIRLDQLNRDVRDIAREFQTTLKQLLPVLEGVQRDAGRLSDRVSILEQSVSGLAEKIPGKWFFIGLAVAVFAAFLTIGDPKGFWTFVNSQNMTRNSVASPNNVSENKRDNNSAK